MEEKLELAPRNGYRKMPEEETGRMNDYCARYMDFLKISKTERSTITNTIALLEENGFTEFRKGQELKAGDRIYFNNRRRSLVAAVIGEASLDEGVNIVASHVDSPRLDVRPKPMIQESELALLKTHYYGWLRKHQWVSLPLMMEGVVYLEDGSRVDVRIGADPEDPVLVIPDLLPHISGDQNKLPLTEAHKAEKLNILMASVPLKDCEEAKAVKLTALKLLNEKYGLCEEDFASAELEIVPALDPRDVGLDRSLIGAYGQDDRVCGYAGLEALISLSTPKRTAVLLFADKEEVGNNGVSGARSRAFDYYIGLMCKATGSDREECYHNSFCMSGDVTSAFDPNYPDAFAGDNTAIANGGIAVCKYTGFGGKEEASDAHAELLSYARGLFKKHGVVWQTAEMGRIDLGGGGTVALEFANRGIDTLDAGVAVLGMHSPFEVVSKLDCYMTYKAYKAIFEE